MDSESIKFFGYLGPYYALFALMIGMLLPLLLILNKDFIGYIFDNKDIRSDDENSKRIIKYVLFNDQFINFLAGLVIVSLIIPIVIMFAHEGNYKLWLIIGIWVVLILWYLFVFIIRFMPKYSVMDRNIDIDILPTLIVTIIGLIIFSYHILTLCSKNEINQFYLVKIYIPKHILYTSTYLVILFIFWIYGAVIYRPHTSLLEILMKKNKKEKGECE